jgi:hypothetical protein
MVYLGKSNTRKEKFAGGQKVLVPAIETTSTESGGTPVVDI